MTRKQKTFDEAFSFSALRRAYLKSRKGTRWKCTVQSYVNHAITRIWETKHQLQSETLKTGRFHRFPRMERGKLRHIQSVGIKERVVQRCLCDEVLVPMLSRRFIYDNAACVKGKGTHFAMRRMKTALHRYWLRHGDNGGYILQFDFRHYFETIPHAKLIESVGGLIEDKRTKALYSQLINDFDGEHGLGLGSQVSQISALYYPHAIDEEIAYRLGIESNARFMDDGWAISDDKRKLHDAMDALREMCLTLGLVPNEGKTVIRKLSGNIPFLKARFRLQSDGNIIIRPNRTNVTRNRRKLRRMADMVRQGKLTYREVREVYKTTRGNLTHFDAEGIRKNYTDLFRSLFQKKEARKC